MEPFIAPDMDDFYLFDVMYGSSDSEEEIICTSCARGRLRQSVMMPRLPSYKVIHKKKVDFQRHLGVAESEIQKRTLGRGRAKCRQIISQNLPPVGRSGDSPSESSADERIYHVGLSHRSPSWKNELRKPKTKPLILTSDFPHLSAKSKNEHQSLEETRNTADTKNGTNFKDMANYLMDSWEDAFTEEGQFEDVAFNDDSFETEDNSYQGNNQIKEDYLQNEQSIEINSDLKQKTDEYFKKLEAEMDNLSLNDFENISVSEASKRRFSQSAKESVPLSEGKAQGGIWYSGDDAYISNSKNDETWTDSDDTDVSVSTESLLPCDKSTLPIRSKVKGCDVLPRAKFDLTLPGDGSVEAQGNVSNVAMGGNTHSSSSPDNAVSGHNHSSSSPHTDHSTSSHDIDHMSSSPDIDHSTLSVSKTESDNQRTSATSDKDESETSESFKKISRKNKKKNRDAARAKDFHSNYPDQSKHDNDQDDTVRDKQVSKKCQKNNLSLMDSNACQRNGQGSSHDAGVSWKLKGDSVIQLDGLPVDCDISVLQDLIASYGTVKDIEKKEGPQSSAVRFRLNSTDACEMVVCCLDDTDIFEGAASKISCVVVQ
ncbi:protein starmaker-like isoform X2 [Mytilus trossulus]|uniref:protein starmaker-like isoform X2 n=1 Tax=Mytilus trossulus TaxID=6551 RepID=UPI00300671DC